MTALRSIAAVIVALVTAAGVAITTNAPELSPASDRPSTAQSGPGAGAPAAFLQRYVDVDGRVVRHDQGGDTVSEGQAYAMLVAAATREREVFDRVWGWTKDNLERDDGLLSWHWKDGRVVDAQPAADADLDAARALLEASTAFGVSDYARDGQRLAAAIVEHETVVIGGRRYLLPGPWARADGDTFAFNPSYLSPRAFEIFGWTDMAVPDLPSPPPDWARLDREGRVTAAADAGYSYDAARVPIRLAESHQASHRDMAAALWPRLRDHPFTDDHPVGLVGAAAAAYAAGDAPSAARLVERARALDAERPSYYGAAWVALGELWFGSGEAR